MYAVWQRLSERSVRLVFLLGLIFSIAGLSGYSEAAQSSNCTAEGKAAADKHLRLNKKDQQLSIEKHLPWGIPTATIPVDNEGLLVHRDYVIDYDRDLLVPVWTAHRLDAKGLGKIDRINCFRRDPRIKAPYASLPSDYAEPIFDQGHLSPNGDMSRALYPVLNSFIMSNMAPQYCQFNRGVWQILESLVRLWVKDKDRGTLYVITGSVFDRDNDGKRDPDAGAKRMKSNNGKSRVAVPSHFYKILIHQKGDGTVEPISFLLPLDQTDLDGDAAFQYLEKHIRSIEEIEAIAGLRFFPKVAHEHPEAKAATLKSRASSLWPFTGKRPRSLANSPQCKATAGADL
jgi:DNA/RNA endonuclease G (NUC1)